MKKIFTILFLSGGFLCAGIFDFAIGPKISTLGLGGELSYKINGMFKARTGFNYFDIKLKNLPSNWLAVKEQNYDGNLQMLNVPILIDFHPFFLVPFFGSLAVSGGFYYNGNNITMNYAPSNNLTFNGEVYTPQQIGTLNAEFGYQKISPYVGVRYDSIFEGFIPFALNIDVGVLYQGNIKANKIELNGSNLSVDDLNAAIQNVATQMKQSQIEFFPVISVGIKIRF